MKNISIIFLLASFLMLSCEKENELTLLEQFEETFMFKKELNIKHTNGSEVSFTVFTNSKDRIDQIDDNYFVLNLRQKESSNQSISLGVNNNTEEDNHYQEADENAIALYISDLNIVGEYNQFSINIHQDVNKGSAKRTPTNFLAGSYWASSESILKGFDFEYKTESCSKEYLIGNLHIFHLIFRSTITTIKLYSEGASKSYTNNGLNHNAYFFNVRVKRPCLDNYDYISGNIFEFWWNIE